MTDNPVLNYMVMRDLGWLVKGASRLSNILGATALATSASGIGYGEWQRRKIKKLEDQRELVGAINDTLSRRRVADIYEMAGMPAPHIPLAVSKNVSPQYSEMLKNMS